MAKRCRDITESGNPNSEILNLSHSHSIRTADEPIPPDTKNRFSSYVYEYPVMGVKDKLEFYDSEAKQIDNVERQCKKMRFGTEVPSSSSLLASPSDLSEPPDIRNSFSSYVYESSILNTEDESNCFTDGKVRTEKAGVDFKEQNQLGTEGIPDNCLGKGLSVIKVSDDKSFVCKLMKPNNPARFEEYIISCVSDGDYIQKSESSLSSPGRLLESEGYKEEETRGKSCTKEADWISNADSEIEMTEEDEMDEGVAETYKLEKENGNAEVIEQRDSEMEKLQNWIAEIESMSSSSDKSVSPEVYCFSLMNKLMKDPVILSNGQVCDRWMIEPWLRQGRRTCPLTNDTITDNLTPHNLLHDAMLQWAKKLHLNYQLDQVDNISQEQLEEFKVLLQMISSKNSAQHKIAAVEIRQQTEVTPEFCVLFSKIPEAISYLIYPLLDHDATVDPHLQENVVATILNLAHINENRELAVKTKSLIRVLVASILEGTKETKANAAQTFCQLAKAGDSSKAAIGRSGAIEGLVLLLKEEETSIVKHACLALHELFVLRENRETAIRHSAVSIITSYVKPEIVNEFIVLLVWLSVESSGVKEIIKKGGISVLLNTIRSESTESSWENCISILDNICCHDEAQVEEIKKVEKYNAVITGVVKDGSESGKKVAMSLLKKLGPKNPPISVL